MDSPQTRWEDEKQARRSTPDNPAREALIERLQFIHSSWTMTHRQAVMLPGLGATTCGEVARTLNEAIAALRTPAEETEAVAERIKEVCREEGLNGAACGWRSCTGCHESSEGVPQGDYSPTFQTHVGFGCGECGGLGVVWEYWSKDGLDDMARDLTTPPVDEAKVRVKPLEWEDWNATTSGGEYSYYGDDEDGWIWTYREYPYGDASEPVPTEAEARLACQADYERRILSALSPAPAVDEKQGEGR